MEIAICQLLVTADKAENINNARRQIENAASKGAKLVLLPEGFNCPYGNAFFPSYAEEIPDGPTTSMLKDAAKAAGIFLVGGSIPEKTADGSLYNTSVTVGPDGTILATHRKVHLFEVDVPGGIKFKESETLSPGDHLTTFDTPWCKVGVGICYDIRFPEFAQIYAKAGCTLLVYPGAFTMTTGPAHWELLQRARAVDNQVYVATASPARVEGASYVAWGHSSVVDPWGAVIATTGPEPATVFATLDLEKVVKIRQALPYNSQKRADLYELVAKKSFPP